MLLEYQQLLIKHSDWLKPENVVVDWCPAYYDQSVHEFVFLRY